MKLQLSEIINLYHEINGINKFIDGKQEQITLGVLKQKLSLKTKLYLSRLNKILIDEYKLFEELKNELIKKYGVQSNDSYTIENDNVDKFNKEVYDLLVTEKEIDTSSLWGDDMSVELFNDLNTEEYYPVLIKLIDK
jgi:hypothetical protein